METKKFTNPTLEYNTDSWTSAEWGWEVEGELFEEDLWDMEVTFTKKPKAFKVGDQVIYTGVFQNESYWTVIAVHRDLVWAEDQEDGETQEFYDYQLKHA